MQLSVREARAQFAAALTAVENGERVTITKNGKPIAELGPPTRGNTFNWERMLQIRKEMGFDKLPPDTRSEEEWFADFNDPIFTELMLNAGSEEDLRE